MTKKADPKFSAGARVERAAFRAYLRREILSANSATYSSGYVNGLEVALRWVLTRQARYDKASGGLGKQ